MKIIAAILCLCTMTGCAYMHDRGRDMCDVVTASLETGQGNIGVQVGKASLGMGITEGKGIGSRSGALGKYDYAEVNVVLFGAKRLVPNEKDMLRGKGYDLISSPHPMNPDNEVKYNEGGRFNSWQIELTACLGLGARLGLNLAELADLVLGLLTVDFLDDDLATIEKQEQDNATKSAAAPSD